MSHPAPWADIGRHALMPEAGHDEAARFDVVAQLNTFLAGRLAPAVRDAYEGRVRHAFRMRHGHEPRDRREVAEAMSRDPAWRTWSLVRRNTMEMRQHAGRQLVGRQAEVLRDRVRALNEGSPNLHLDPSLDVPRYVAAMDTHLMRGGYAAERMQDDVANPANYDSGFFATVGGMAGPWNDAAGRALAAWLEREHPAFKPRVIVDLGCGLGHNTLPLRKAFPEARIVAIDVAAPFLRYGHARARSLGVDDVEFRQEDATATSLPDRSADLVYTTMVLHETSAEALPRLLAETRRLLRPGGLAIHLEQPPYRRFEPFEQFMRDWDGRYNNEPFWTALHDMDLTERLVRAGFARDRVFETECRAPTFKAAAGRSEDFGRAPAWYAVGAWQAANGLAAIG
ncbi:MAG: class I SAM-dependent methyltransferase [Gammaproteobacteria bacterium]|nr:class I SAM-dependent methyltransferase [Gammaproteobacteria bacterium]